MNCRDMLKAGVAAGALGLAPRLASAQVTFCARAQGLAHLSSLTTTGRADGRRHAGLGSRCRPSRPTDWQRPGTATWTGNAKVAERVRDPKYGAEMLRVEWAADQQIAR